jgi:hypothetical protein
MSVTIDYLVINGPTREVCTDCGMLLAVGDTVAAHLERGDHDRTVTLTLLPNVGG